mmetsp:Transcript_3781/g.7028  ORF Transcript_3781/g.7028 Transcript_3781/m.7028 type:complete len:108 (-) Transcript_3781:182-505(-)
MADGSGSVLYSFSATRVYNPVQDISGPLATARSTSIGQSASGAQQSPPLPFSLPLGDPPRHKAGRPRAAATRRPWARPTRDRCRLPLSEPLGDPPRCTRGPPRTTPT